MDIKDKEKSSLVTTNNRDLTVALVHNPNSIKSNPKIKLEELEEDDFTKQLSDIVQRDFFPNLKRKTVPGTIFENIDSSKARRLPTTALRFLGDDVETPRIADPDLFSGDEIDPQSNDKPKMSVDQFLGKYTSEDNASFSRLIEKQNADHRNRHSWLYEQGGNGSNTKESDQKLIGYSEDGDRKLIEGKPGSVETWKYKTRNALMFSPEDQDASSLIETGRGKPKRIIHKNTRFCNTDIQLDDDDLLEMDTASSVGLGSATPTIRGYKLVDGTPTPTPTAAEQPSPSSNIGSSFKILPTPRREMIGLKLASMSARKQAPGTPGRHLSSKRDQYAMTPGSASSRYRMLSPAAKQLFKNSSSRNPFERGSKLVKGLGHLKEYFSATMASDDHKEELAQRLRRIFRALVTVTILYISRTKQNPAVSSVKPSVDQMAKDNLKMMDIATIKDIMGHHFTFDSRRAVSANNGNSDSPTASDLENHIANLLVIEFPESINPIQRPKKRKLSAQSSPDVQRLQELKDKIEKILQEKAYEHLPIKELYASLCEDTSPDDSSNPSHGIDGQEKNDLIEALESSEFYKGQIVSTKIFPKKDSDHSGSETTANLLHKEVIGAFKNVRKIQQFYKHQNMAISSILSGNHVVVSTPTASGKSVIYQAPILHHLIQDQAATAMMIFPTKALAQDQKQALADLVGSIPCIEHRKVEAYDGDVKQKDERRAIRQTTSVILTNPDTLHMAMLPNHKIWHHFLYNLRIVVLDELHIYQGQFGQHVSLILGRLCRILESLGNNHVQFVSCSATISNPIAKALLWNPSITKTAISNKGLSKAIEDVVRIITEIAKLGLRAIVFCKYRELCELTLKRCQDSFLSKKEYSKHLATVVAYRGGYSAKERKDIEKRMFRNEITVIISTSALELGVDIGSLDAVVMLGVPNNPMTMWQQAGRAGRRSQGSYVITVSDGGLLDGHYILHPEKLWERIYPKAQISSEESILSNHLQCAAFEMQVCDSEDAMYFGPELGSLLSENLLQDTNGKWATKLSYKPWPPEKVAIRSILKTEWAVFEQNDEEFTLLEELDQMHAMFRVYQGLSYLTTLVDQERKVAIVEYTQHKWLTKKRDYKDVVPKQVKETSRISGKLTIEHGSVDVKVTVFGYHRVDANTGAIIESFEHKPWVMVVQSFGTWIDIPISVVETLQMDTEALGDAIHALQHVIVNSLVSLGVCLPGSLETSCKSPFESRAKTPR
ncbi:ATP-dependent 3'-5' DNA helicase [Mycoemilia scoparia]|uniref:ATP-dependent 3'-5' DNA helicase n=1 Tax=Mycoemilia scoparia TaxID=417184 RepID=A0A9W8A205_9FUNG|nr:ATP-dependent 3'-5' DNA helicase [Mycoemilia scoparia]